MSRKSAWKRVFEEWRYWNPELDEVRVSRAVRGCRGKYAYPNFLIAMQSAASLDRIADKSRGYLNVYHCRVCHKEHVGNLRSI